MPQKEPLGIRNPIRRLKVFSDDYDTYVAYSLDGVYEDHEELNGVTREEFEADGGEFHEVPGDRELSILWGECGYHDDANVVTMPARWWAIFNGPGHLCGSEC